MAGVIQKATQNMVEIPILWEIHYSRELYSHSDTRGDVKEEYLVIILG